MTFLLTATIFLLVAQDNLVSITHLGILSYLDEFLAIVLVASAALMCIKRKKIKNLSLFLIGLLVGFICVGVISCAINSKFVLKSVLASCFLSTKYWLIVLSVSLLKTKHRFLGSLYKSLFVVEKIALIFAAINIISPTSYAALFPSSHIMYRFGMLSVCSIFNHPGKYGWFMLFCALAHLSVFDKTRNKKEFLFMVISIIACLLSLRTKVILGLAVCISGYFLLVKREEIKKQIKKIITLVVILSCLLIPFGGIVKNTYTLYFTDAEGYSVRQALSDNSKKIAKEYFPLGVGFGKYGTWYASQDYSEYYSKYGMDKMYGMTKDNTSYSTDTFWPAILGETGYVGTAIYIVMIGIVFRKIIQKNDEKKEEKNQELLLLAPLVLILTIVESFGSASFMAPPEYFMSAFVIGLSISIRNKTIESDKTNEIK